jgi:acetyltransferase-like isoleucine patch superfamily enzyme
MLKDLYKKICLKIYNTGSQESQRRFEQNLKRNSIIGPHTKFYPGSNISNLSNKRENIAIGQNCHIYGLLLVYNYAGSITIGDNCSLSEYSRIVSGKKIVIGSRVMIAHNVNILDNNSHPKNAILRHEDFLSNYDGGMKQFDLDAREIVIEDDVWIGFNSIILKGVKIGRGAIIGAGSVVLKDVEPWTINVGNPLRCVEKLDVPDFNFK